MTSYSLVLPPPWERVPLDGWTHRRVSAIVDRAVARLPRRVSPDEIAPHRYRLESSLIAQLDEARANGGADYYLPTDLMHGLQINANFVVSAVTPDAVAEIGLVPRVLVSLLTDPDSQPVTIADTVWVRREKVAIRRADSALAEDLAVRRVDYRTAIPGDERRWVISTLVTPGADGIDSDHTGLLVEMFDAIMSTWTWTTDEES